MQAIGAGARRSRYKAKVPSLSYPGWRRRWRTLACGARQSRYLGLGTQAEILRLAGDGDKKGILACRAAVVSNVGTWA